MKVKILESSGWYKHFVGSEFEFVQYVVDDYLGIHIEDTGWIYRHHCVITELPESFCVKRCDDGIKWGKYIQWLNKTYNHMFSGFFGKYYGYLNGYGSFSGDNPLTMEIHIDDMIKHIDYMESQQHINGGEQFSKESQLIAKMDKIIKQGEFDLTTYEGRLAYAKKYYPIGTKYIPLDSRGNLFSCVHISQYEAKFWNHGNLSGIEIGEGLIYCNGEWAEIIKEETNMNTQKLSRQGLKEIHSIACSHWKYVLEGYGSRNPLEDYIELYQEEVNKIFNACTKEQLPIVSKYLKQDDGSVDIMKFKGQIYDNDGRAVIEKRCYGEYAHKSLLLEDVYNWEIKKDSKGKLCLIPTKKK